MAKPPASSSTIVGLRPRQFRQGVHLFREAPERYLGGKDAHAALLLIGELLLNARHEAQTGHATKVVLKFLAGNTIAVVDNGRGIPVDIVPAAGISALEVILTDGHDPDWARTSDGLSPNQSPFRPLGLSFVNAVSQYLEVEVARDGCKFRQTYSRGVPTSELIMIGHTDKTGTSITITPDEDIFGHVFFNYKEVRDAAHTALSDLPDLQFEYRMLVDYHNDYSNFLAESGLSGLSSASLLTRFATRLHGRLRDEGLSGAEAAQVARTVVADFRAKAPAAIDFKNAEQIEAAIELIVTGVRAGQGVNAEFNSAAAISLPPKAPEVWAERDRSKGESPISFLNRVWEPWLEAGVLYQDDIKRLGDDKLIRAIRSYCQKHRDIKASNVLPPPGRSRLERALANADPDSAEASALRTRLAMRASSRRHARKRRATGAPFP